MQLELVNEYRTRLIADVVTGKLDVRGVVLPELAEIELNGDWIEGEDAEAEDLIDAEETVYAGD